MKPILVFIFILLIAMISCNKTTTKVKINDDLLNFCFKEDTYWVYIDSASNTIDSVFVYEHDHFYRRHYHTDYSDYKVEYFTFSTRSSLNPASVNYEVINSGATQLNSLSTIYSDYDNTPDGWTGRGGNTFTHLDSIFVYDQYYYRVLKRESPDDTSGNYNKNIYYTNAEYGILRQEIYSDSILTDNKILMRKNIRR